MVSATLSSDTSMGWNRRAKARSFSMYPRSSLCVVVPMQRMSPADKGGFNKLDASMVPPEAAPAPTMV